MTKNDITIGKLMGQMEAVRESLSSLHDKFDTNADKCVECRKDIEEQTVRIAKAITKDGMKSVKIMFGTIIILALLSICGYFFHNYFIPSLNIPQMSATAEASDERTR